MKNKSISHNKPISFHNHPNVKDLSGKRFGRIAVIKRAGSKKRPCGPLALWLCRCDCGQSKIISGSRLQLGTRSCGCLRREVTSQRFSTHGKSKTLTYKTWSAMIDRCCNPNASIFKYYGAIGIMVCDRWRKFEAFLQDIGERPSLSHSIDRFPNGKGNYEPGNCRWATRKDQSRNQRTNHFLTFNGKTQCLTDWALEMGMQRRTLGKRLDYGMSVEEALTRPIDIRRRRKAQKQPELDITP